MENFTLINLIINSRFAAPLQEISKYRNQSKSIGSIHNVTYFPIMRLDANDLKRGLQSRANGYADQLLNRIADNHRAENERYTNCACRYSTFKF